MKLQSCRILPLVAAFATIASLTPAQVFISEFCNDPFRNTTGVGIDTNADGTPATSLAQFDDEFVEIVNIGVTTVDISNWTISDVVGVRHTFANGTMLPQDGCIVVFGGPNPVTMPTALNAFNALGVGSGVAATTGQLGLNNGGDTITLRDAMGVIIDTYMFGNQSMPDNGDGESVVRDPEMPGATFIRHSVLVSGVLHSAGLHNDGVVGWNPAIIPPPAPPMFPGNGTDAEIAVYLNSGLQNNVLNVHAVPVGTQVGLEIFSPAGTLVGLPYILAYDIFLTGNPPSAILLPGDAMASIWLTPATGRILVDGLSTAGQPLAPVIAQNGSLFVGVIPVSIGGLGISLMVQMVAVDPGINAVNLGSSHAHELQIP